MKTPVNIKITKERFRKPLSYLLITVSALTLALPAAVVPLSSSVFAATSGPNSADVAENDGAIGTIPWNNPGNALTQNDSRADATIDANGEATQYLKLTDFDFAIPTASNVVIDGILVEIDRDQNYTGLNRVFDNSIRLVKNSLISGDDRSTGAEWPDSDTDTYASYGGQSDLWGLTWTPADINATTFGVAVSAIHDSTNYSRTARVDHVRITVTYHVVDTTSPTVSSINRAGANPTKASSVGYTINFSEAVTGVDITDFTLVTTGVTGAAISGISGSGSTYTVTVNTGTGDGTIRLDLDDNDSIIDGAGNPLGGSGAGNGNFTGQVYDIDRSLVNPESMQTYYVPFPEDQLLLGLRGITGTTVPTNPMTTYVSIAAVASGTIIYYDQWENGYDADIANPTNLYSAGNPGGTQIWGDGDPSNGAPPGIPSDIISAGTVIILNNELNSGTLQAVIDFDGRDKIGASKPIAVTRTGWASGSDTLLAGSVEVYEYGQWGTEYRAPVGENIPDDTDYQMFSYTGLYIMAGPGGATISVDANADGDYTDANDINSLTIAEGVSRFVNGGVNVGARVISNNPVQVDILTGDRDSTYESRDSALLPVVAWSASYYTPVSTQDAGTGDSRTTVWLYNPSGSAITVNYEWYGGSSSISVPLNGYAKVLLTETTSGYHFYTTGGQDFYAFSTTDSASTNYDSNQAWDWGFSLIPEDSLSSQVINGLGIGRDPTSGTNPGENGNPVWVVTVGNGTAPVNVYVDYDGDGLGPFTDPNGRQYDELLSLRELERSEIGKVYDSDGDQTGMILYVLDPNVRLAAAWGQDPNTASAGAPGLDVGTSIPPLYFEIRAIDLEKGVWNGVEFEDADEPPGPTLPSSQDPVIFEFVISNNGNYPLTNVQLTDVPDVIGGLYYTDNNCTTLFTFPISLPAGDSVTVYGKRSWVAGQQSDNATVIGTGLGGIVSDSDPANYVGGTPKIEILKYVWDDLDDDDIQDSDEWKETVNLPVGGTAVFRIVVTNTGDVDLTNVTVTDPLVPNCELYIGNLAAGATFPAYTGTLVNVTDSFTNTAYVTGKYGDITVNDDDPAQVVVGEIRGAIGDFVWYDINGNGIQDSGEPGIGGVLVELYAGDGTTLLATTNTFAADGSYLFNGLPPGDYVVKFIKPDNYDPTNKNQGADDTLDSDADTTTGMTATITLGSGETNLTIDAGFIAMGPAINIQKMPDLQIIPSGGTAVFKIVVTNTGNVPLVNVAVTDPMSPDCNVTIGNLAVGASYSYTCSIANVMAGFTNVATVNGKDEKGTPVSDADDAVVEVITTPAVGGEIFPTDKLGLLMPVILLLLAAGGTGFWLVKRRISPQA